MSRTRFYFSFTPAWAQSPWAKWGSTFLGAACVGGGVYGFLDAESNLAFLSAQGIFYGGGFLAHGTGLAERYFGRFVDLSLGTVRWRLIDPDGSLRPRYEKVSLAKVRSVDVGVLRIDFAMVDGSVRSMPLGELPYDVVREVKRRFEGENSLAGATMGLRAPVA